MSNYLSFEPTTSPPFYFVSYNSEDVDRVAPLTKRLFEDGVPLWYDYGLEYGTEKWKIQISKKIMASQAVILFLTKKVLQKENTYVHKEYNIAQFYEKTIYVVLLDSIRKSDVPPYAVEWYLDIIDHQCVAAFKFSDLAEQISQIEHAIGFEKPATPEEIISHATERDDPLGNLRRMADYIRNNRPIRPHRPVTLDRLERHLLGAGVRTEEPPVEEIPPTHAEPTPEAPTERIIPERYSEGLAFSELPDHTYAVSGMGSCTDVHIRIPPTTPEGGAVTAIGKKAFKKCNKIEAVTIPNSVTSIGEWAFGGCTGLTSITIPNSVTSIDWAAFEDCIGLTSITIPNSVTSIGSWAFYGCTRLTSITIPSSVTEIGLNPFAGCTELTSLSVDPSNPKFYSQDNCVIEKGTHRLICGTRHSCIPSGVTSIGGGAFVDCTGLTSITIPNSVTSIGNAAFRGCTGLTSITIPNSVTSIGNMAFGGCTGLISITIPSSVTSIGKEAFWGCTGLTSITIPNSVTSIGENAFRRCNSLTIYHDHPTIPSGWHKNWNPDNRPVVWDSTLGFSQGLQFQKLDDGTYAVTGLGTCEDKHIRIPPTTPEWGAVTAIGKEAFEYCNKIEAVTIPNSVTSIGKWAFGGCTGLTSITIPSSVTEIGGPPFFSCTELISLSVDPSNPKFYSQDNCIIEKGTHRLICGTCHSCIPSGVTSIGDVAFFGCTGLTSIIIPSSVTSIGSVAFYGCTGLTSVTIPSSVTEIGEPPFAGCTELISLSVDPSNPKFYSQDNCIIEKGTHRLICGIRRSCIPSNVTSIENEAFFGCTGLTSVTIPNSVTSIGNCSFQDCTDLTSITIPSSVTSIGVNAFRGCNSLTIYHGHPTIPSGWHKDWNPDNRPVVWDSTLGFSQGLRFRRLHDGTYAVTGIGTCEDKHIRIPPTTPKGRAVTAIGKEAFEYCNKIEAVTIPNSVTSIGDYAFNGCTGLTSLTIPNSVTSIGDGAFWGCTGLTSITIPSSVTEIGFNPFAGCTELTSLSVDPSNSKFYSQDNCVIEKGTHRLICGTCHSCIPSSVTSIGVGAFFGCTGLTSITIPNNVTSIGEDAFWGCTDLTSITIPSSVTSIGENAFQGCNSLTIYHDHPTIPSGWHKNWNPNNRPVRRIPK